MSLKVGFVGLSSTGWAATVLAPALTHPSLKSYVDIVAVSTTRPASATASASTHAALVGHPIRAYDGPTDKIAADDEVNFVAVSVQAPSHKEALGPVIEKGKNFFVEWPVTGNLEDALEVERKVGERGLRTLVGLQGITSRHAIKIREIIKSGKIGTVRSTSLSLTISTGIFQGSLIANDKFGYYKKSNGISGLSIAGGHQLATLTSILGDFARVHTTSSTVFPTITLLHPDGTSTGKTAQADVPDHYVIAGTLHSGVVVNLFVKIGYHLAGPDQGRRGFRWEIEGDQGALVVQSKPETPGAAAAFANSHYEPEVLVDGDKVDLGDGLAGTAYSIAGAWKAFAEGKESGPDTYPDIRDAVKLHRLLAAIEESGETGKAVEL